MTVIDYSEIKIYCQNNINADKESFRHIYFFQRFTALESVANAYSCRSLLYCMC